MKKHALAADEEVGLLIGPWKLQNSSELNIWRFEVTVTCPTREASEHSPASPPLWMVPLRRESKEEFKVCLVTKKSAAANPGQNFLLLIPSLLF